MQSAYLLGVLFAIVILTATFFRLRSSGMKECYATWWIIIALTPVIDSFFPQLLHVLTHALGVQVSLNLAFFVTGIVILLLTLRLSVDLSRASEGGRALAEEIVILNSDIGVLRGKVAALGASEDFNSRD